VVVGSLLATVTQGLGDGPLGELARQPDLPDGGCQRTQRDQRGGDLRGVSDAHRWYPSRRLEVHMAGPAIIVKD
jgi:hypothetical protein